MLPELATLVNQAILAYPGEEARIQRGAKIVEHGGVRPPCAEHATWRVGVYHWYPIDTSRMCPCPDRVFGHAPNGRCKHRWALCLYRRLHGLQTTPISAGPSLRTLAFYGSYTAPGACEQVHGIVEVREDGLVRFQMHKSHDWLAVAWDDVVLGGRKDMVDAT